MSAPLPRPHMSHPTNGIKKWLIGAVTAATLAYSGWTGISLYTNGGRISKVEGQVGEMRGWLERVEGKLDRVLERR